MDAGLELLMKPIEYMSALAALDVTPSLSNGDMALPLRLQAVTFFLQKDVGQHGQGPEPPGKVLQGFIQTYDSGDKLVIDERS